MEFYWTWPASTGEWLGWISALVTVLFGAVLFAVPRAGMALLGLQPHPERPHAIAHVRATMAGFYLGVGICCILFAQPFFYLALGASWALTLIGRVVSIVADRAHAPFNLVTAVVEAVLAALPLAYVFGYVA